MNKSDLYQVYSALRSGEFAAYGSLNMLSQSAKQRGWRAMWDILGSALWGDGYILPQLFFKI
jgi:hypothetical protein